MHYNGRVLHGFDSRVRVQSYNIPFAWNQLPRSDYSDQLHTPSTLLYTAGSSLTIKLSSVYSAAIPYSISPSIP